jgi:RNA-binding protein YhbY
MAREKTTQLQIGKNGLTEGFVGQVKKIFEKKDRVKISILKSACRDKKEAEKICLKLADALGKNFAYTLVGYVCTIIKFKRIVRE